MAGINVNDVVGIQIHGLIFAQRTISTWWYRCLTNSTAATYPAAAQIVADAFDAGVFSPGVTFSLASPQNWTWSFTRVQVVAPTRKIYVESNVSQPGQMAEDATTPNLQASITRRAELGTRRNLSALHSVGLPPSAQDDGVLSVGYKTLLNALAVRCLTVLEYAGETLTLQPIIWGAATPTDATRVVTSTIVQDQVRTMNRRTLGRGI